MKRLVAAVLLLAGLLVSCGTRPYYPNNAEDGKVIYDAQDGYYAVGVPIIQPDYFNR